MQNFQVIHNELEVYYIMTQVVYNIKITNTYCIQNIENMFYTIDFLKQINSEQKKVVKRIGMEIKTLIIRIKVYSANQYI